MPRNILNILFLLFICCKAASGQSPAGDYNIKQYSTENGLPSNGIKGMQWDEENGFLWIATEAGVSRFNGIDFKNFTRENTAGMASERLNFMVRNDKGGIFASDLERNIFTVRSNKLVLHSKASKDPNLNNRVRFSYLFSDTGLYNKLGTFKTGPEAPAWQTLLKLKDTGFLMVDVSRKLHYFSMNSPVLEDLAIPVTELASVFCIGNECFIAGKNQDFFIVDGPGKYRPVKFSDEAGNIFPVKPDQRLLVWESGMQHPVLIIGKNAWLLDYSEGNITARLICTEIPTLSFIRSAQYSEKNKLLFIATDSKGIIVINSNRVRPMKKVNAAINERNAYYSQVALPGNAVLTNEAHVIGAATIREEQLPIKDKFAFNVYNTEDSLLWFAQSDKLLKVHCLHAYDRHTGITKPFPKIIINQSYALTKTAGNIYIANFDGIGRLQGDSIFFMYRFPGNQSDENSPFNMMELKPGVLGIPTCSGFLSFDTKTAKLDTLFREPGYCVRSFWKYGDYLFLGTYGKGFYISKNNLIKKMPVDKNNFLLYTHCFVPDEFGYCWMSTNRGLFKAKIADLINAYEKDETQVYYHYFGKNDGMDITEMNGGCAPCALVLKNKIMSFPTMDGLLWVNPETANPLLPEGNIYVDEMMADDRKIDLDSATELKFPASVKKISFNIGFSAWCNKENIYVDYQLNNAGKWQALDVNNGANITFTNLPPGKYTIRLRKMNGFGVNNYSYREIVFTILTPWYKQWWFFLICLLSFIGLISGYAWLRTRQFKIRERKLEQLVSQKTSELQQQNELLEKNNTIKNRLISIISHDIITPLKFLTVAGKNLLNKRSLMPEELQDETIREITYTSQELHQLSTNILNWIKYQQENRRQMKEHFNLHETVEQIMGVLRSFANQKKIELVNEVPAETELFQFAEPLKILIYNLVSNAINFSETGPVTVACEKVNRGFVISVKDRGVGMTPEQVYNIMAEQFIVSSANVDKRKGNGLGYLIIKDLLKMTGATMNINSEKGIGTTVLVYIQSGENNGNDKKTAA